VATEYLRGVEPAPEVLAQVEWTQTLLAQTTSRPPEQPTEEEVEWARTFREMMQRLATEADPFAIDFMAMLEKYYPGDTAGQVRLTGYINELAQHHPDGRVPKAEAAELARKWGVERASAADFIDLLPQVRAACPR
jgi:hypothetical protein